jgi:cytochrome c oxidase subunit 2
MSLLRIVNSGSSLALYSGPVAVPWSPTNIFAPASTPAHMISKLSYFALGITGLIFLVVATLIIYALFRYRARAGDESEPPQIFGSTQIELAWTIIPILIIVVLFFTTARVIFAIQDAPEPSNALNVTVIGHQYWWEFRYPQYGIVTANELHVPVSNPAHPTPTYLDLTSADVVHSFWVPRLAGKTDLLPNRVNHMWIDPYETGLYFGQCAQFCGAEHAKMLLRIYIDSPTQFAEWIKNQQQKAVDTKVDHDGALVLAGEPAPNRTDPVALQGEQVFMHQACINCHTIRGTVATGRFGPDLTHLMSREMLASGIMRNTPDNLERWIEDPNAFKPGCLMPAMHLSNVQNAEITRYLLTLN